MPVVSAYAETLFADRAFRAGAHGYVMKDRGLDVIVEAAWTVLGGERYVSPTRMDAEPALENGWSDPVQTFSDRELEVSATSARAAAPARSPMRCSVSTETVETYRANINRKLGIRSAPELVQRATLWAESLDGEA